MIPALASLIILAALPLRAQQVDEVRRGEMQWLVQAHGGIAAEDVFRLRSPIDGRAEDVWPSTGVWVLRTQQLGILLSRESAAFLDAGSTLNLLKSSTLATPKSIYEPLPINCPHDCFLMKSFLRSKQWVKYGALLFEAATSLRLEGVVPSQEAQLVRDGMILEYWDTKDPARHLQARIIHYRLEFPEGRQMPVGTFTLKLDHKNSLAPGTDWKGTVLISKKSGALRVPTKALLRHGNEVYLPVQVSTGITTQEWTEITSGVKSTNKILVLGEGPTGAVERHAVEMDVPALFRRLAEQPSPPPSPANTVSAPAAQPTTPTHPAAAAPPKPAPSLPVAAPPKGAQIEVIHEPKVAPETEEDPYSE